MKIQMVLSVHSDNRCLVTPGITALEYAHRRSKLASKLPERGIAVIAASDIKYRSGAVFYDFHQDSDFFYLTGTLATTHLCRLRAK